MEASDFLSEERKSQETHPLTDGVTVNLSLPTENKNVYRSSFESFAIFKDANFFDTNDERYCKKINLFQGTRRFCRLCLFGLLVPVFLISIPLYLRLILYPPTNTPMAPTDQRLISGRTSSFWCQGQTVKMNGSFNTFLIDKAPRVRQEFSTHIMRKHIVLKDDIKEYWGFFLQRGSVVIIDLCNRYDGGFLMILRGVNNLRKCAWIGEKDSDELGEDDDEESDELRNTMKGSMLFPGDLNVEGPAIDHLLDLELDPKNMSSFERKRELNYFMGKIFSLGKNSQEIDTLLWKYKNSMKINMSSWNSLRVDDSFVKTNYINDMEPLRSKRRRGVKDQLSKQLFDSAENTAVEELDNNDAHDLEKNNDTEIPFISAKDRENELYKQIFHLPKGVAVERGTFFQRENNDSSREEQRSSFSSSEEALLKCEGLLGAISLFADRRCLGPASPPANKVTYKIPVTGTYYFVFSSDNEVFDSNLYFNMTLQRVVFDTGKPKSTCLNKTTCSMSFSFWSHDQAIVEVPEGDWDSAFIINSKCEPRVAIYLFIMILIPFFIICFAFN